jgi:hypothetical protein
MIKEKDPQNGFVVAIMKHAEDSYQNDWLNKADKLMN